MDMTAIALTLASTQGELRSPILPFSDTQLFSLAYYCSTFQCWTLTFCTRKRGYYRPLGLESNSSIMDFASCQRDQHFAVPSGAWPDV